MAFQLTRLNVPSLTTDYSAETNAAAQLAKTVASLPGEWRKAAEADQKRQLLGSLGSGTPDYNKVGLGLLALGDTQGGAAVLGLGQKQQQLEGSRKVSDMFSGATLGNAAPPSPSSGGVPFSALGNPTAPAPRSFERPVQVAENEDDVLRLETEMAQRERFGYGNPNLPAGMRNNNPGNIKYVSQRQAPGVVGPSQNTDQGDPQAVFNSPEAGMAAAYDLALRKYQGGKRTALDLIAGQGGWTPGNTAAAANVARSMGISPDEDLRLDDPQRAQAFMRSLIAQEHGRSGGNYPQEMIAGAVGGRGAQVAQAPAQQPAPSQAGPEGVYGKAPTEALQSFINNPKVPENYKALMRQELERRSGGQAPVQIAEATPQPGAPVNDAASMPAPGAQPVTGPATTQAAQQQGFAIPGTSLPPNDPYPNLSTKQLYGVATNPNATPEQQRLANGIIERRLKYTDENAPDKREMTRLQTEKLRREVEGDGGRPMTPDERKAFNVRDGQPAFIKKNGDPGFGPAGTSITNSNSFDGKGESKFNEALGTAQAKRWNGYIEEGDVAQGRLADIQTLRETSRRLGSQGSSANLKATIGPYAESLGIKVEGLPDIQLYESITNRLAPNLRAPGSGSTSDIEFKGFQRAIGPLSNNPAAREMILDTFEAASRNDLARAEIGRRLASGEINRQQAEKEIGTLPNPLEGFKKFREANPDLVGQAIKETGQRQVLEKSGPPKITSPEQARSLPSGTEFIDPNGVKRRVP